MLRLFIWFVKELQVDPSKMFRSLIQSVSQTHYHCHHIAHSAATSTRVSGPIVASYISSKVKEELISLHMSEPGSWTSSKLAHRFRIPEANVRALLKLSALRPKDDDDALQERRNRVVSAWKNLTEPYARDQRHRQGDTVLTDFGPHFQQVAESDMIADENLKHQSASEELESFAEKSDTGTGDSQEAEQVEDDEDFNILRDIEEESVALDREQMSATARWVEQMENDPDQSLDHVRKTTFIFTEVGKGLTNKERAVWIREGATGKLRAASLEERKGYLKGKT